MASTSFTSLETPLLSYGTTISYLSGTNKIWRDQGVGKKFGLNSHQSYSACVSLHSSLRCSSRRDHSVYCCRATFSASAIWRVWNNTKRKQHQCVSS